MIGVLLILIFILCICLLWLGLYVRTLDRDTTQALKVAGLIITDLAGRVERLEAKERGREGR